MVVDKYELARYLHEKGLRSNPKADANFLYYLKLYSVEPAEVRDRKHFYDLEEAELAFATGGIAAENGRRLRQKRFEVKRKKWVTLYRDATKREAPYSKGYISSILGKDPQWELYRVKIITEKTINKKRHYSSVVGLLYAGEELLD